MKIKSISAVLVAGLAFIIAGCGGGGGGGGGITSTPTTPTTATGKFVDAPVEGLKFVSGGQSGLTDANGTFTYEVGKPVTFSIGGVTIGQASGAGTVTPIDLVNNANSDTKATPATPAVVRIVQFLLTASSVTATGIKVDTAVTNACTSQSINLSTADSISFNSMITQVATAAGGRTVVNATNAQNHFTASYNNLGTVVLPDPSSTGGGAATVTVQTKVVVKLATAGTIPAGVNIGAIDTTVTYPTNKGLSIADSDVVISGVAAGSTAIPNTKIPGQVRIANINTSGFPIGEFASLTFSIAPGNSPVANDFAVALGATILDNSINIKTLNGVTVVIQSVTFL